MFPCLFSLTSSSPFHFTSANSCSFNLQLDVIYLSARSLFLKLKNAPLRRLHPRPQRGAYNQYDWFWVVVLHPLSLLEFCFDDSHHTPTPKTFPFPEGDTTELSTWGALVITTRNIIPPPPFWGMLCVVVISYLCSDHRSEWNTKCQICIYTQIPQLQTVFLMGSTHLSLGIKAPCYLTSSKEFLTCRWNFSQWGCGVNCQKRNWRWLSFWSITARNQKLVVSPSLSVRPRPR